jgi:hypothetical protein
LPQDPPQIVISDNKMQTSTDEILRKWKELGPAPTSDNRIPVDADMAISPNDLLKQFVLGSDGMLRLRPKGIDLSRSGDKKYEKGYVVAQLIPDTKMSHDGTMLHNILLPKPYILLPKPYVSGGSTQFMTTQSTAHANRRDGDHSPRPRGHGQDEDEINTVMLQAVCTREQAIEALDKTGNIVDAILSLTP